VKLKDLIVSSKFILPEVENTLRKYGAVVIPSYINVDHLCKLQEEWEAIYHQRTQEGIEYLTRVGGDVADYVLLNRRKLGNEQFPFINKIFSDRNFFRLANRVVGHPYCLNEEVYATYDIGRDSEIAASHFDKTWNLKFMIYLHDITEIGWGAFGVHPGTQSLGREIFRKWFDRCGINNVVEVGSPAYYQMGNDIIPTDLPECIDIFAPAGTLIIFGTDIFHRAGFLSKGNERKILRGHTAPGYFSLRAGYRIKRYSRQWLRAEPWEINNKPYHRFSTRGFLNFFQEKIG